MLKSKEHQFYVEFTHKEIVYKKEISASSSPEALAEAVGQVFNLDKSNGGRYYSEVAKYSGELTAFSVKKR